MAKIGFLPGWHSKGHITCTHAWTHWLPYWRRTESWQRVATWHACDHGVQLLPATLKHLHSCTKAPSYLFTNDTVIHVASKPKLRVKVGLERSRCPPATNWSQEHIDQFFLPELLLTMHYEPTLYLLLKESIKQHLAFGSALRLTDGVWPSVLFDPPSCLCIHTLIGGAHMPQGMHL